LEIIKKIQMDPLKIIEKYYEPQSTVYQILFEHSRRVAEKAIAIAKAHPEMNPDIRFIEEAAMLHDIGIIRCNASKIECFGHFAYICHGYIGAGMLQEEGLPRHALVCERHTGTGISLQMIEENNYPLPHRDFLPVTLEEQIICFADKFFSKTKLNKEKSIDMVRESLRKYGEETILRFNNWCKLFLE
jgi:uncharacterized protein